MLPDLQVANELTAPAPDAVPPASIAEVLGELRAIRQALERQAGPQATLIGIAELARMLDVSQTTLHRLRAAGQIGLAEIRVGGAVKYAMEEVREYLRHRQADGQLHDRKTWPAVWQAMQQRARRA